MFIRKLTKEETAQSQAALRAANAAIKNQRKALTARISELRENLPKYSASLEYRNLMKQRENLRVITGMPVRLIAAGEEIVFNYEFLRKICRNIHPSDLYRIEVKRGQIAQRAFLDIKHRFGEMQLYELPHYQAELLKNLPVIGV